MQASTAPSPPRNDPTGQTGSHRQIFTSLALPATLRDGMHDFLGIVRSGPERCAVVEQRSDTASLDRFLYCLKTGQEVPNSFLDEAAMNNASIRDSVYDLLFGQVTLVFPRLDTLREWIRRTRTAHRFLRSVEITIGPLDTVADIKIALRGIGKSLHLLNLRILLNKQQITGDKTKDLLKIQWLRVIEGYRGLSDVRVLVETDENASSILTNWLRNFATEPKPADDCYPEPAYRPQREGIQRLAWPTDDEWLFRPTEIIRLLSLAEYDIGPMHGAFAEHERRINGYVSEGRARGFQMSGFDNPAESDRDDTGL